MPVKQKKNLARLSLFPGSILIMAFSMLSVIVLLIWWQRLLSHNLENQYRFFAAELAGENFSPELRQFITGQDEKLAILLFKGKSEVAPDAEKIILSRLANRKKMLLYEQIFFILLLLSGHIFFLYIYYRERLRRRQTEETILFATHELRQPLQSLSLALETLAPRAKGKTLTAISAGLRDIGKLGEIIRFLAVTFAGKPAGSAVLGDIPAFFGDLFRTEFAGQGKRIVTDFGEMVPLRLNLGMDHLKFLVRNLTENALQYATPSTPVSFFAESNGKLLTLRLTNAGNAIASTEFRKIGGLFFRSAASSVQNQTGFGLGLYLCGRIARRARGRLTIEHDAKGNTIARLTLPGKPYEPQ